MNGHFLQYVAALVVAIIMLIIALPWIGGAIRDSKNRAQRNDWAERERKRELDEAIRREQEAFEEALVCAELDLLLDDLAEASDQFQRTLDEAFA